MDDAQDPVSDRLEALAAQMKDRFGDAVQVRRTGGGGRRDGHGAVGLDVEMTAPSKDALSVCWFDTGNALQVQVGCGPGGRWELGRSPADVNFLQDVVASVVAGRVEQVSGPAHNRSRVSVTLADGTQAHETGYTGPSGCLPRPGWKRRGHRVSYQAWDG